MTAVNDDLENNNIALYLEDKSVAKIKGKVTILHGNIKVADNKEAKIQFTLSREFIPDDIKDLKNKYMLTLGENEEEGFKQLPKGNVNFEYSDVDLVIEEGTINVFALYQKMNDANTTIHICNVDIPNVKIISLFDGIEAKYV